MEQVRTFKLSCSSCGSALQIASDIENFACAYCGTNQIVERAGGVVRLKSVTQAIGRVQVGTDKTAAELALNRLNVEIAEANQTRWWVMKRLQTRIDSKYQTKMWLLIGTAFIVMIFVTTLLASVYRGSGLPILVGIGFGIATFIFASRLADQHDLLGVSRLKRERDAEVFPYDQHIAEIQRKIEHNRSVANS
jgi:predicted RNA-binding Zn-ribbon protein involved in translation (DUF1610 family)